MSDQAKATLAPARFVTGLRIAPSGQSVRPLSEYEDWLAAERVGHQDNFAANITATRLRRIVQVKRDGEKWDVVCPAVSLSENAAKRWYKKLPEELR